MTKRLHLDFETRAPIDLKKVGARRYAEVAEPICAGWAINDKKPKLWWPGDPAPKALTKVLTYHAWNAGFERAIWAMLHERYGWPPCPSPLLWVDTQARAALAGLPLGLGPCAAALGLPADKQKDARGRKLIQLLCKPQEDGTYNEDPDLIREMGEYCQQDVVTERAIEPGLPPMTRREHRIWCLTESMNETGVPLDTAAAGLVVEFYDRAVDRLNDRVHVITKGAVDRVSQVARLTKWMGSRGVEVDNLRAETVDELLDGPLRKKDVREVLTIRRTVGLASLKKYHAADLRACLDDRLRDSLRYHGAGTGRWSSVGMQLQNLKRPGLAPAQVDAILTRVAQGGRPSNSHLMGLQRLSDCVRGLIVAEPGHVLVASDYSQIELRVLLWLARDKENLKEIRQGLNPYKTMATDIYPGTEYEDIIKGGDKYNVAKATVLGCGYSLGGKTFATYAKRYGCTLNEVESQIIVDTYRSKHHKVVAFWYALQDAAIDAIKNPGETYGAGRLLVRVLSNRRWMELMLPSGRPIRYYRPRTEKVEKPWGMVDAIMYEGRDTYTRKWGVTETYGGKLVENATQGFARDIMAAGMLRAEKAELNPIMTVHDEVVCHPECYTEAGVPTADDAAYLLEELNRLLTKVPAWAAGLPLEVEGWTGTRYRK